METKEESYGKARLKDRLVENFGKEIHFSEVSGNLMFTRNGESILRDSYDS